MAYYLILTPVNTLFGDAGHLKDRPLIDYYPYYKDASK
jgi:hypothetical protein